MYFLIDYENVKNAGMRGVVDLLPSDFVIVFYSAAAPNMESQYLDGIKNSSCSFEVCKLIQTRKNALDFYISTRLGAIFGSGYAEKIAIISRDTGFQAVRDYWNHYTTKQVLISESIERAIISANEANQRTSEVRKRLQPVDIGNFFAAYEESLKLKKLLEDAFAGTELAGRTGEIEEIVRSGKTPKVIYLDTLRRFGKKNGLFVYKTLKTCAELFAAS